MKLTIQNQEEHIGHVKQIKSDRYQDRNFLSQAFCVCAPIFCQKVKTKR